VRVLPVLETTRHPVAEPEERVAALDLVQVPEVVTVPELETGPVSLAARVPMVDRAASVVELRVGLQAALVVEVQVAFQGVRPVVLPVELPVG